MDWGPECLCRINKQGVNLHSKDIAQTQQQKPESPIVTPMWVNARYVNSTSGTFSAWRINSTSGTFSAWRINSSRGCTSGGFYVLCIYWHDVFMYLVCTGMTGESYRGQLWSLLLCLHDVFMYLVFTGMTGESYRGQLWSLLLCLHDVFQVQIDSLLIPANRWAQQCVLM